MFSLPMSKNSKLKKRINYYYLTYIIFISTDICSAIKHTGPSLMALGLQNRKFSKKCNKQRQLPETLISGWDTPINVLK